MKSIEILLDEHKLILRELELMTTAAEKIVRRRNPPREFFELAGRFTNDFTNRFHHHKEEIVMFGLLAEKNGGSLDDEVARLRNQHKVLHELTSEIAEALDRYEKNDEDAVHRLHRSLCLYVDTLRHHVTAENRIFYPLVVQTLTKDDMAYLDEEFEKAAAREPNDPMEEFGQLVDKMEQLV